MAPNFQLLIRSYSIYNIDTDNHSLSTDISFNKGNPIANIDFVTNQQSNVNATNSKSKVYPFNFARQHDIGLYFCHSFDRS